MLIFVFRCQVSGVGCQRTEIRNQRSEVRRQRDYHRNYLIFCLACNPLSSAICRLSYETSDKQNTEKIEHRTSTIEH